MIALLALAGIATAQVPHGHPHDEGLVVTITGTGRLLIGATSTPLQRGLVVPVGATVCTDAASYATLRLAKSAGSQSHDEITLFSGTCTTLDAASSRADGHGSGVTLQQGSVAVRASEGGDGQVRVTTESGSAVGTGGYRVTVEDGSSRAEALSDKIVLSGAGVDVPVAAGFGSRVVTGQAPTAPIALLVAGMPTLPGEGERLLRPEFAWTPVDRALGYRVELSTNDDFTELVQVEDIGPSRWEPDLLFLPFRVRGLWWRVSSFDRTGFQGIPSDPRPLALPAGVGP